MCEKSQEELQQLAEKYQDQLKEVSNIQGQLQVLLYRIIISKSADEIDK